MIDYYLHKKCPLTSPTPRQKENIRCNACVWLDKSINKCIFSLHYPKTVYIEEFIKRINNVDNKQQFLLSEPFKRFSP